MQKSKIGMHFFVDDYQEDSIFLRLLLNYENIYAPFSLGFDWGICCDYFGFVDYKS
jgi:hypothetical protein